MDKTSRKSGEPTCPLRPGQLCQMCQLSVRGPWDCQLVYFVMGDPEMLAELTALRDQWQEERLLVLAEAGRRLLPPARTSADLGPAVS